MPILSKSRPKSSTQGKAIPKVAKPAKSASTTLATVASATLQTIEAEAPASSLSKSFIKEATSVDRDIVALSHKIAKDVGEIGLLFQRVKQFGYHKALGFSNFKDYVADRWPDSNKTTIYDAINSVRVLTQGDRPPMMLSDLSAMPVTNANGLVKLKKQGYTITPDLVESAKTMPIKTFQQEIVLARSPELATREAVRTGATLAMPEILVRELLTITALTKQDLNYCKEIFRLVGKQHGEDFDPNDKMSFDDKFYSMLAAEFRSAHEAEYQELKAAQDAAEMSNAQFHSDSMGQTIVEDISEEKRDLANSAETSEEGEEKTEASEPVVDSASVKGSSPVAGFSAPATCEFLKGGTVRCGSPALRGQSYCYYHGKQVAKGIHV